MYVFFLCQDNPDGFKWNVDNPFFCLKIPKVQPPTENLFLSGTFLTMAKEIFPWKGIHHFLLQKEKTNLNLFLSNKYSFLSDIAWRQVIWQIFPFDENPAGQTAPFFSDWFNELTKELTSSQIYGRSNGRRAFWKKNVRMPKVFPFWVTKVDSWTPLQRSNDL